MENNKQGLEVWRQSFAKVRLPLLSNAETRELIRSPEVSLQEIHHALLSDLSLSIEVIQVAEQVPRIAGEVQGLQHAVNALGVGRIQRILAERESVLFDPTQPRHQACLQAMATSHFAAELVRAWQAHGDRTQTEFLAWVALLQGFARWKLPLAAPAQYEEIDRRVREGERRSVLEQTLLGCPMSTLNAVLLQDAGVPTDALLTHAVLPDGRMLAKAASLAWDGVMAPELPLPLARWLRQRTTISVLAHLLAWSACDDWYGRRTLDLLRIVSAHRNQPLVDVITEVHETAVEASRHPAFLGLNASPAERLFWPPLPKRRLSQKSVMSDAKEMLLDDDVAAVSKPNPQLVETYFQSCMQGRFRDLRLFFTSTARTLERGLCLKRCLVFIKNPQGTQLRCVFAYGFHNRIEARQLAVLLGQQNLLARLVTQNGALRVTPAKLAAARGQLPEILKPLVPSSGMLLASLPVHGEAHGAMWVDADEQGEEPSDQQYQLFRHMIQHLAEEFHRLEALVGTTGV